MFLDKIYIINVLHLTHYLLYTLQKYQQYKTEIIHIQCGMPQFTILKWRCP